MNELDERRRIILQHRLRAIQAEHGLPKLDRARMYRLCKAAASVLGEDGLTDRDLRVLHRLTTRGLLDRLE